MRKLVKQVLSELYTVVKWMIFPLTTAMEIQEKLSKRLDKNKDRKKEDPNL